MSSLHPQLDSLRFSRYTSTSDHMALTPISFLLILSIPTVISIRPNSVGNPNVELSILRKGDVYHRRHTSTSLMLEVGGFCSSMEMYACQRESQSLVISEIANWMQAEKKSNDFMFNSLIFASLGIWDYKILRFF